MASPAFRLPFTKDNLDKLLRLKRARPESLFPKLHPEHLARLAKVVSDGTPCTVWEQKQAGLSVLINAGPEHRPECTVTFRATYYTPDHPGVPRYRKLGAYPHEIADPKEARELADDVRSAARKGDTPKPIPVADNDAALDREVSAMMERFIANHASTIKSGKESARILRRYVMPEWRGRPVEAIRKSHVNMLHEKVSAGKILVKEPDKRPRYLGTPAQANAVLAQLSKFFNWYAGKWADDDYNPPIHKDMRGPKLAARRRWLSDDEIRVLWSILDRMGVYGAVMQTALLTGQRFGQVGRMRREDLHEEWGQNGTRLRHVWDPTREDEPDNKHASLVPMSDMAWSIVQRVPIINDGEEWVFTENGINPFNGWSNAKERLDAAMRETGLDFEPWQARDLRRTARTLMARAGVPDSIAEHCLGHVLPTIQRVYNRYDYGPEKQVAFAKLAELVEQIVHPKPAGGRTNRR